MLSLNFLYRSFTISKYVSVYVASERGADQRKLKKWHLMSSYLQRLKKIFINGRKMRKLSTFPFPFIAVPSSFESFVHWEETFYFDVDGI